MKVLPWLAAAAIVVGSVGFLSSSSSAAESADTPPPIVEDFAYPGADKILAEHNLKLFKGDGHILFVTSHEYDEGQCATGEIQVEKQMDVEPYGVYYCFKTIGTKGILILEVPGTFGVRGGTKAIEATANLPEGQKTYDIPANGFVAISPGDGSETPKAVLVELRLG
jgi:hypothetical protein